MDDCEHCDVKKVDKYFEGKTWYITRLTGSTKKSTLCKLSPAATSFGQLAEKKKNSLWQFVCIYELFISDRARSFKVAGILNMVTL